MAEQNTKIEWMPDLQNIKEYIENHFMDELIDGLLDCIRAQAVEGLDFSLDGGQLVADRPSCSLISVDCWYLDRTSLLADMKMRLKIGASKENGFPRFGIRIINFSIGIELDGGIRLTSEIQEPTVYLFPERNMYRLTNNLVPVLSYEEMDSVALDMITTYLGPQGRQLMIDGGGPLKLAKAMGLNIRHGVLYGNVHTKAILFFKDGSVDAKGSYEMREELPISAKTIFINDGCKWLAEDLRYIAHECVHYLLHSMFYELQCLNASDLSMLGFKAADQTQKVVEKDLYWIERQANVISINALLPKPDIVALTNQYWQEVSTADMNLGGKIEHVIMQMAEEKNFSKSLVRTRLLLLGKKAAKGAYNYVDGELIDPFAFSLDSLDNGETFVINRKDFIKLYEKDEEFRKLMDSHQMIYVDGHVCLNQPVFVRYVNNRIQLTTWALAHIDECCLKFKKSYIYDFKEHMTIGQLQSSKEYNEEYLMIASMRMKDNDSDETMDKCAEYLENLPRRPAKLLSKLIEDRVKTQRELSYTSGLSTSTIGRMCNDDAFDYDIKQVTRLVVGLRLPPLLSSYFLEVLGFPRTVMIRYIRYQCIIDCMFMDDINMIVETHDRLFQ